MSALRSASLLSVLVLSACGPVATHDGSPASVSTTTPAIEDAPRGVLLILCDTLRADMLDPYGGDVGTPTFSRIADDGTLWLENYAQGSWTLPSMLSLMTGRWVVGEAEALPASAPSLAPLLAEAGFATSAFVANPVCGAKRGFDRGFDTFREFGERTRAEVVTEAFTDWVADAASGPEGPRNWFSWVHLMDNHGPYTPDMVHLEGRRTSGATDADRTAWRAAAREAIPEGEGRIGAWLKRGTHEVLSTRERYRGTVRAVDEAIGQVLAELEALDLLETTLVVIASDHGELLFEHRNHRSTLRRRAQARGESGWELVDGFARGHDLHYREETWRTPLLMMGPGVAAGARVEHGSANLDLLPTLVAALGLDPVPGLDGNDLFDPHTTGRDVVFASGVIERRDGLHDTHAVLDIATDRVWAEVPRAHVTPFDAFDLIGVGYDLLDRAVLEAATLDNGTLDTGAGLDSSVTTDLRARLAAWKRGPALERGDAAGPEAAQDLIRLGYVDGDA